MEEASAAPELDRPRFDAQAIKAVVLQDDRRFGVALALAIMLHVTLLVGVNSGAGQSESQRRLGDPKGADEAISVALITEADLRGRAAVDDRAGGEPAQSAPPAQAAPPPPPPTPPQSIPEPEKPVPPAKDALVEPSLPGEGLKKDAEPKQKVEKPPEPQKTEKAEETKAREKQAQEPRPRQQTRTAKLDLSPPPAVFAAPFAGGGAGVERPPGITRSGENDAFARGVIRALQRTMPQLSNTRGRVTVRITLDKNGSLVSTQVLRPSQVASLDQYVVFATKQSSFPFPPRNAIPADLIFVVTYIYR